jgi:glycosyltransferase involved in cell wall biosynthesis
MAKKRILIVTQSPILATGMAEAIRLIFGALLDRYPEYYELHQVGLTHSFSVASPRWPVYATKGAAAESGEMVTFDVADLAGEKTFPEVAQRLQPDIVFGFNDPQRLLHLCKPANERNHKLVLYVNFDGLPFPPVYGNLLKDADAIVTMSAFSRQVLLGAMPMVRADRLSYLYSPADTNRFVPPSPSQKSRLREEMFPPWMPRDAFILLWVGRAQWRKQVWILYELISHLRKGLYFACSRCRRVTVSQTAFCGGTRTVQCCRHCGGEERSLFPGSENTFLWLHTPEEEQEDWKRAELEEHFELSSESDIHYTAGHKVGNWKLPAQMPSLYQISDCLLYLSGGEGFGLPAWEAMSSALPVVYTNYSAHGEFLSKAQAGFPVSGILQPEPKSCVWRMIADVESAIAAVLQLLLDSALRTKLGTDGRHFVERFTPEIQAEKWHWLFQTIAKDRQVGR